MQKRLILVTSIVICFTSLISAKTITISPAEPLPAAMESLIAGDILILQNGTYSVDRTITLSQKGTENSKITIIIQ